MAIVHGRKKIMGTLLLSHSVYSIYVKRIPTSSVFIAKERVSGIWDHSLKGTLNSR